MGGSSMTCQERHGFKPRLRAERPQDVLHMVSDGLLADGEIAGDLLCRATLLEEAQDLRLTGSEPCVRGRRRLVWVGCDLTEDADDVPTLPERDRADLDADPLSFRVEEEAFDVRHLDGAEDLLREEPARATGFLGRDNRGVVAAPNIAD